MGEDAEGGGMSEIVYRCDPEKNKACRKTACQKECTHTKHREYSADGIPLIYNSETDEYDEVDGR